ncbi:MULTISPECIES: ABC transporter permease [unclassified Methanoculleus]|jgi:putative ABC transport system permease protein|uniref:ABC transporter permease n=1 Tax=unclassified Methanoculleus TaxID=2619537 RepID=UPI00319E1AC0
MRSGGYGVSLYLAVRAIRRGNRGTLALTILVIALVVVLINFLTMIIGGVVEVYDRQMIDFQYGHLTIEPREKELYIDDSDDLVDRLKRIPGVTGVSSRVSAGATITNTGNGKFQSKSLAAFDPDDEKTVTRYHQMILEGEFLSEGDTDQILIGSLLAGSDDEAEDKLPSLGGVRVGDLLEVAYGNGVVKTYRVKGIFETYGLLIDSAAFVTREEMDAVMQTDGKATEILVKGSDIGNAGQLKITCMQFGVQERIKTWSEKGKGVLGDAIESFNLLNSIMTVVSLIVASVVVFIVTFINIVNRRKQIGILKAIGIQRRIIVGNYLFQVMFLCTCGAAVGVLMLFCIALGLGAHPIRFPMGFVSPTLDLSRVAVSIACLYLVSLVSGYIPARYVAKEEILSAMRG